MIERKEEFRCQEEASYVEVASLQGNHEAVTEEIDKASSSSVPTKLPSTVLVKPSPKLKPYWR